MMEKISKRERERAELIKDKMVLRQLLKRKIMIVDLLLVIFEYIKKVRDR